MAENPNWAARSGAAASVEIDQGLRSFMLGVYNYMAIGLVITGAVAYAMSLALINQTTGQPTQLFFTLFASPLKWLIMLAPLGMVFFMGASLRRLSLSAAQLTFWAFAALMGLSLSTIFLAYTSASIVTTFFASAAAFAGLSLWGYSTKRDLSAMGSFLMVGLIGIIIAMLVNMFLKSSGLEFAISIIGVLIFAGLTAFDTQRIKEMYSAGDDGTMIGRKSIYGALQLYLDFINLFLFLLRFMGNRR
ncbi:MAG: Bax inhibitor-1/YccA family protein [Alphaproteobacteria bacterium]